MLVVVLSITVGGGLLAREWYRQPDPPPATDPVTAPLPSESVDPNDRPGSDVVKVTADVANHPQNNAVRTVLQAYFRAVNDKNYAAWADTVTDARRARTTMVQWHQDFKSTKDGTILLYRIEPGAQGTLRALVGFTSTQSLDEAPQEFQQPCIRWRLVMPMKFEHNSYRIDTTDNTAIEHDKC